MAKGLSRSKLEKHLAILGALVPEPANFDSISYKTDIGFGTLERHLNFLVSHRLVEERLQGDERLVYAVTQRGLTVFRTIQAQKYLQKLRNILHVEETKDVAPLISKTANKLEKA